MYNKRRTYGDYCLSDETTGEFRKFLLQITDDVLRKVFTETATQIIYRFIEDNYSLKREEIPEKLETFIEGLQEFFRSGALVIEQEILKEMHLKLGLKYKIREGYKFADYIDDLENVYQAIKNPPKSKWIREWPDFYRGGVDYLSTEEAKELVGTLDQKGLMHAVYVYKKPYVGGICNCEYPTCIPLRISLERGWWLYKKAEYVTALDQSRCDGCGKCVTKCQFGAIKFSPMANVAVIDPWKCFGCGLCRQVCEVKAISLAPRETFGTLKNVWW